MGRRLPKILFVIDSLEIGGAEKSILEITSRLRSFTPVVCHLFVGEALKNEFESRGVEVFSLNLEKNRSISEITSRLYDLVLLIRPILIHSTLYKADQVSRRLKSRTGLPLVNSFVNNSYSKIRYDNLSIFGKAKLCVIQYLDRSTANNVDMFVSNSETIKKTNCKALQILPEKVAVIYRGRDRVLFDSVQESDVIRVKEKIGVTGFKVMLCVGRLIKRKGQMDLVTAFSAISDSIPGYRLVLVGDGAERQALEDQVKKTGMSEKILILGARRDVPVLLRMADLFVLPSHFEGLPGVLIEAMLSRTPIVASDIAENLECVSRESASLFRAGDVKELSKALLDMARDIEKTLSKTQKAYEFAVKNFGIDNISRLYETLYKQLIA